MAHKVKRPAPARFQTEDRVRVRRGVRDPDFPDIPLGGWAGRVRRVERARGRITYLIAWDRVTLGGMHPIYRKRCERDGLELEEMWLGDEDLEPDDGTPHALEQPTAIVTRPLSRKDQDDRIRMVFGLTHDDPLPEVGRKTLRAYHRYLSARLKFPFRARSDADGLSHVVHRLPDPEEYDPDEDDGLLCEVRGRQGTSLVPLSELDDAVGNRELVKDYGYWFCNWG